jgi:hypothetical protein
MDEAACLAELTALAVAVKVPDMRASWVEQGGNLRIVYPLSIGPGVVAGLRLELVGPKAVPHASPLRNWRAMLLATAYHREWRLGRIEFDPTRPHLNQPDCRRKLSAPPKVVGPHIHPFDRNSQLGLDALSVRNLPAAFELDAAPSSFDGAVSQIRAHFAVELWPHPEDAPPWQLSLVP